MRTHVALLRGVNVGGHNKLAMSELRAAANALGWEQVATYIQSGNVVFSTNAGKDARLAEQLKAEVQERSAISCEVVVLGRDKLAAAVAADPFEDESDARLVHLVFRAAPPSAGDLAALEKAQRRASEKGSSDTLRVVGGVTYLHTPGGLGRSVLAAELARAGGAPGTARNRATATKLLALLDEES